MTLMAGVRFVLAELCAFLWPDRACPYGHAPGEDDGMEIGEHARQCGGPQPLDGEPR